MGIFDKYYKWKLCRELTKVDLIEAAEAMRLNSSKKQMVIPRKLASLLQGFLSAPNEENAAMLIAYDPKLAGMFAAFSKRL